MRSRRRWLWILLFILTMAAIAAVATDYNVVLVQDYQKLLKLARSLSIKDGERITAPWMRVILGSLGFLAALCGTALVFLKLLKEMRLNQLQSEFLASVTHALKTPIATIELSASLLRAGVSPDETRKLWDSHTAELKRLKEQVDTLLEAARMQTAPGSLKKEIVTIETWLSQSLQRWRQILGPESKLLRRGQTLGCEAWVDVHLLNLITDNLIDNSRKFARGQPSVTIESQLFPTSWRLRFSDEGWGFDPHDAEKVFNRFFRGKTEAPYAIPGTGLGLFLAATASKSLGIKLRAESNGIGKGASFTLEGPRVAT